MVLLRQVRIVEADVVVQVRDRILPGRPALVAGGQVDPRLVRHQRVVEVERRLPALPDRPEPLVEPRGPSGAGQAREHARPARACSRADGRRAHRRRGLHLEHVVAEPVEHVEDARLVAPHVRGCVRPGQAAVEDRRHGAEGRVVHRRRVREPRGDRRQPGEVRESLGVDAAIGPQEVVGRELVEDDEDHRRPPLRGVRLLLGAGEQAPAEQQRGRGQFSRERAAPCRRPAQPEAPRRCCGPRGASSRGP
jgi:hypothetical protein